MKVFSIPLVIAVLAFNQTGCVSGAHMAMEEVNKDSFYFVVGETKYKAGSNKTTVYNRLNEVKGSNCTDYGGSTTSAMAFFAVPDKKLFECKPVSASAKQGVSKVLGSFSLSKI